MSSRFSFRRPVRELDSTLSSPHSNCSTPASKRTNTSLTPTSVSPHPRSTFQPPSLQIPVPEPTPLIARLKDNSNSRGKRTKSECTRSGVEPLVEQQFVFLTVPSESENPESSPQPSEPEPSPDSAPNPLDCHSFRLPSSPGDLLSGLSYQTQDGVDDGEEAVLSLPLNSPFVRNYSTSVTTPYSPVSCVSVASSVDTPIYGAHLLEAQGSNPVPDLCLGLAPLDAVSPSVETLRSFQVINNSRGNTPTFFNLPPSASRRHTPSNGSSRTTPTFFQYTNYSKQPTPTFFPSGTTPTFFPGPIPKPSAPRGGRTKKPDLRRPSSATNSSTPRSKVFSRQSEKRPSSTLLRGKTDSKLLTLRSKSYELSPLNSPYSINTVNIQSYEPTTCNTTNYNTLQSPTCVESVESLLSLPTVTSYQFNQHLQFNQQQQQQKSTYHQYRECRICQCNTPPLYSNLRVPNNHSHIMGCLCSKTNTIKSPSGSSSSRGSAFHKTGTTSFDHNEKHQVHLDSTPDAIDGDPMHHHPDMLPTELLVETARSGRLSVPTASREEDPEPIQIRINGVDEEAPVPTDHDMSDDDQHIAGDIGGGIDDEITVDTRSTMERERKDIVNPFPPPSLDKLQSVTKINKRMSASDIGSMALSSLHNLGVPMHIVNSSDDEEDPDSMSTTESSIEKSDASKIKTPGNWIRENSTIEVLPAKPDAQSSQRTLMNRPKRRKGVSDRRTLTGTQIKNHLPVIPPLSPRFETIKIDVNKNVDFLSGILRQNLLFKFDDQEFAEKMVSKVVSLMQAADFEAGEVLIQQGDEGDAFYAVDNGNFDILVDNNDGEERIVAQAKRGDCVGEYALLYNQPRTATLKASTKSRVWGITAKQFHEMRQEVMDWNVKRFDERQKFIASIPLFSKLEQHELLNMTHACQAEIFEIEQYIISPDDKGRANCDVYIIMEGTVLMSHETDREDTRYEMSSPLDHHGQHSMNEHDLKLNLGSMTKQISDLTDANARYHHPFGNLSDLSSNPRMSDQIILQEIDMESGTGTQSGNGRGGGNGNGNGFAMGFALDPLEMDKEQTPMDFPVEQKEVTPNANHHHQHRDTINNQQDKPSTNVHQHAPPLALSAMNSVQSTHSINVVGGDVHVVPQYVQFGKGEREIGKSECFARHLFNDDLDIVFAKAHTRCKLLKIARDDFVLIVAAAQSSMGSRRNIFSSEIAVDPDGTLPDNKTWKNHRKDIRLEDLEEKDVLGRGSFGKVTLVRHKTTGDSFALKAVSKYRVRQTGQEEHIINEKRVLTMLDSPFCIKLYATFKTDLAIYFLTEVVLGGELFTVLRYNRKFDKHATRFYCGCVVLALEHLHSMDIIYRDLKPENLLLNSRGYLQLTDFGFAKKRNTTCTLCGTPEYLAPEVIHNWVQSFATDWWSLGVLLFEMVVGHAPFEDDENIKMYEKILIHEPVFPDNVNSKLRHLIQKLLEKNAYQRLGSGAGGANQVKQHPFFKGKLKWQDLADQTLPAPYRPNIDGLFDTQNFDNFSGDEMESSVDANGYQMDDDPDIDASSHFDWAEHF